MKNSLILYLKYKFNLYYYRKFENLNKILFDKFCLLSFFFPNFKKYEPEFSTI